MKLLYRFELLLLIILFCGLVSTPSRADQCSATFSDGVTSHSSSGTITFGKNAMITGNPGTSLPAANVDSSSQGNSCFTTDCTASGSGSSDLNLPSFQTTGSSTEIKINKNGSGTIGNGSTANYKKVEVEQGATLTVSSSYTTYKIAEFKLGKNAVANFPGGGTYWMEKFTVEQGASINVTGSGTATFYVYEDGTIGKNAQLNFGGDPSELVIITYKKLKLEQGAYVSGYVYVSTEATLGKNSLLEGSLAATDIKFEQGAVVDFNSSDLSNADFGSTCTQAAASGPDHYRFEYDGSALTCAAETVTVKACANADCSSLHTSVTSMSFDVSTTEPASSSVALYFTGSTTINVAESSPTTVTLSMSSPNPSASLKCYENSAVDDNCDYSLTDTGFLFVNETGPESDIPTQISNKPSNTGFNSRTIVLQAVQTDVNTGACAALFPNGSNVSVDLAYECVDPGSCTANAATVTNNGNTYSLSQYNSYSSHSLLFAADSKATIAITYPDAGKIRLHAKKAIDLGSSEVKTLTGNTNAFVVRPFGFYIGLVGNPGATDQTGGGFNRAGDPFDMTLSAMRWASGEDADNDGVPDSHAALSDNGVALNFGNEATPEGATVSAAIVHPVGGNDPGLTNGTFNGFNQGQQSKTGAQGPSWGDVGVISLTAVSDGNYLDGTSGITSTIPHVGRFYPAHFRMIVGNMGSACGTFSYMGQAANLTVNLAAQGVGDIALANYDSGGHGLATLALEAENNNDGTDLAGRFSVIAPTWADGVIDTTFTPTFARLSPTPTPDGPFDSLLVGLSIADGDSAANISLIDNADGALDMNAADTGDCVTKGNCTALAVTNGAVSYRYGRLKAEQAFGPATTNLSLPIFTEFWNGTTFALSSTDSCSTLAASDITVSGSSQPNFSNNYSVLSLTDGSVVGTTTVDTTSPNTSNTTLSAAGGTFDFAFTPPNFGSVTEGLSPVVINVNSYPWLQFDWSSGGTGDVETTLPTLNATFGQFRGNDRVIYWRERR